MTTVSLPLAIWGTGYVEFLERWLEGVDSLIRQPDQIVIVADHANYMKVKKVIGNRDIQLYKHYGNGYADYWNKAVSLTDCDWFAICNVDDKFLPHALDDIDLADAEDCNLITDRIQDLEGGQVHNSQWNGHMIGRQWTMVGAEPMRKDLFDKAGGFEPGQRFADWALAMKMYLVGVRPYDSSNIRIIYDRGLTRKTVSSILNSPDELNDGYRNLALLSKRLGLL